MSTAPSDVRRSRALGLGALASALGLLVALFAFEGRVAPSGPAPLGLPHERAGVACATCHGSERRTDACQSCHGEHPSARAAHAALRSEGALSCSDCHRVHGAEGLWSDENGALVHYLGNRALAAPSSAGTPPGAVVPLLDKQRCSSCHDVNRASDPATPCFASASGKNLCFDEHARTSAAGPARASGLHERARDVALTSAGQGARAWNASLELGSALALGLLGLVLARARKPARPRSGAPLGAAAQPALRAARRRLPVIDAARCLGCAACVDACPHDVLEVSRYVAIVARPDACCGLALCAERCPNGSLVLSEGELRVDVPRLSRVLEAEEQPGVFMAGDLTGQSLIRVAVEQGARATGAVAASLAAEGGKTKAGVFDLLIVGAGPAGLSAALEARRLGLRAALLEQGRLAENIRQFPREKIVLDSGQVSQENSALWLGECDKDQLVRRWLRAVRSARLDLREHSRVIGARRLPSPRPAFELALDGDEHEPLRARRLLIAIGVRGSPRELDVPIADDARSAVHYSLSDARRFAGRRTVVVGLGDSAMEAAIALSGQEGTRVRVVHRGSDFRRGKRRNIDEFERLVALGRIDVAWSTQVTQISPGSVFVAGPQGDEQWSYDALFVFIGAKKSAGLLAQLGLGGAMALPGGAVRE